MFEFTIISSAEQPRSPWAGGTTTELGILPAHSSYSKRNFAARISCAEVELERSQFTALPGYTRYIMPLHGSIRLQHNGHSEAVLQQYQTHCFQGDWQTVCYGTCRDFNLMLQRGYQGEIGSVACGSQVSCAPGEMLWLYCLETLQLLLLSSPNAAEQHRLQSGDVLFLQNHTTTTARIILPTSSAMQEIPAVYAKAWAEADKKTDQQQPCSLEAGVEDADLFMICTELRSEAQTGLPEGYHLRSLREDELDIWKRMHFDDPAVAVQHYDYMSRWFERVYAPHRGLFFQRCLVVCDAQDRPLGTCFFWEAYGVLPTIHWFKVIKEYEGLGLGRALLSKAMEQVTDYPVFLHTQPGSYRAIKLYSDFGFKLLIDPAYGPRLNRIAIGLDYLENHMPAAEFRKLHFAHAPESFLQTVAAQKENEY